MSIKAENVKSILSQLKPFDYLAKDNEFVEIHRWQNDEGFTAMFDDKIIDLTDGQLDAINYLIQKMRYE